MTPPARSYGWLPGVLREIAEIAGLDAALAIADKRGGTRVYIPAQAADDHWLVAAAGRRAADLICRYFAFDAGEVSKRRNTKQHGVEVDLPLGPLGSIAKIRSLVDRMIAEGRPESEVALAAGYTGRGVRARKARSRARDDHRQGRLFQD